MLNVLWVVLIIPIDTVAEDKGEGWCAVKPVSVNIFYFNNIQVIYMLSIVYNGKRV